MTKTHRIAAIFSLTLLAFTSLNTMAGWEVTWIDKFEGDRVDFDKWTAQTQANYNNEVQCYTDDDVSENRNYEVSDGTLKIIARKGQVACEGLNNQQKEWTSGRLNSKDKGEFLYGRIEARIRFLELKGGTWPAFWMLENRISEQPYKGDNDNIAWPNPGAGEIDVWEWFSNDGDTYITNFFNTGNCGTEKRIPYPGGAPDVMEWATYAIEWDADNIQFLMNDQVVAEYDMTNCGQYEEPMFVLINVAMGGNLGGVIDSTLDTAVMEVDYVAHCEKSDANAWTSCNESTPMIADDDGDGVSNGNDQCPNTPNGVPVDLVGCEVVTEPSTAAPAPTELAENVISLFSDEYTNISSINYNPDWGQATQVEEISIEGNATLKYTNLNYQGTDFEQNIQDVTGMDYLHIDYWTHNANSLDVYVISPGPLENAYSIQVQQQGWQSVKIPLSVYTVPDLERVFQLKISGSGTVYIDNIYFSRDPQQEQNVAPEVTLNAVQSSTTTTSVATDGGTVTVTANISDANSTDSHTVQWSVPGVSNFNGNGTELTFDPVDLTVSQITVTVSVTDSGSPALTMTESITLTVTQPPAPPAPTPQPQPDNSSSGGGSTSLPVLFMLILLAQWRRQRSSSPQR